MMRKQFLWDMFGKILVVLNMVTNEINHFIFNLKGTVVSTLEITKKKSACSKTVYNPIMLVCLTSPYVCSQTILYSKWNWCVSAFFWGVHSSYCVPERLRFSVVERFNRRKNYTVPELQRVWGFQWGVIQAQHWGWRKTAFNNSKDTWDSSRLEAGKGPWTGKITVRRETRYRSAMLSLGQELVVCSISWRAEVGNKVIKS